MNERSTSALEAHAWWYRVVLGALGAVQTVNGLWALLAPRSFYGDFPFGRGWVEALPAYNEHLMRDVGGLFLATGFLLLAAAWFLGRRLVAVTLIAWLLFAVPHAVYHAFNLEPFGTADAVGNVAALTIIVILPALLLALLAGDRERAAPTPGGRTRSSRLEGVPEGGANPIVRYAYRLSRRQEGKVMEPIAVFAHHPTLLAGYGALELAAERSNRVDPRLKHLAELRAAMLAGCEWCLDYGSAISPEHGVDEDDLRALPGYRDSERFGELERLVLEYASAVSRTPVEVPDELFAELRSRLDDSQLVELTALIALENFRARFNWALGIAEQGFTEGSFCVAPVAS